MGRNKKNRWRPPHKTPKGSYVIPEQRVEKSQIPATALVIESGDTEPESIPLRISFDLYNENLCGIVNLDCNQSLEVVKTIRRLGKCSVLMDFLKNQIEMGMVVNANDYAPLYKDLGEDVLVYEHKIDKVSRIFYSVLFPANLCRILAITSNKHFETKKINH